MDAVAPIVAAWSEADTRVHRKQRHTARRIFERLRDEHGFEGGESTVRAWLRDHGAAERLSLPGPPLHPRGGLRDKANLVGDGFASSMWAE